jgi:hypothetical protein
MTAAEFLGLALTERAACLQRLEAWQLSRLIAELRQHEFTSPADRVAVLEPAALIALQRFRTNAYVLSTSVAALLDCGQTTMALQVLGTNRALLAVSRYLMAVFARALGMRGRRNSRLVAFRLAESLKTRDLTQPEINWLHERLNDPAAHAPDFFEPWPQGTQALERPERFDGVLQVPNLPNYSVRMVSSKTQIERFANRLHNCLNTMTERILSDHTRVIGVERDGHPHEAIEVNPRGGLVRQWKGLRNREADTATQPLIEQFLLSIGAIRSRQLGGSWW